MLKIASREAGDVLVLDLGGQIDGGPDTGKVHDAVKKALVEETKKILLNLQEIEWLNSLGLGVLISAYVSTKRAGGFLQICNATPRIVSTLKTAGVIPEVFALHESEADALKSF